MKEKILIYGDSIMRGVTYCSERRRHTLCQGHNLPKLSELGFEVKNFSRMGATVDYGLDITEKTIAECDKNTHVILEYGGNDCDYNWADISSSPLTPHLPRTVECEFEKKYKILINKLRRASHDVRLATLIPVDSEKYIKWITKNNSYDNIIGWLGDVSMLHRWQERYNRIIERIAKEEGLHLLDLREDFLLAHDYKELISEDGIHPSDKGHELIERSICRAMLSQSVVPA